jgi:uncharacterized protein (TIGR03084 family)
MSTEIFDDLESEQDSLDAVLSELTEDAWLHESGATGWTVADVVLHLAQTEEAVIASATGETQWGALPEWQRLGASVDQAMDAMVRADPSTPPEILRRWRTARRAALAALRQADPQRPLPWVAGPLKPRTLATTRLAEHWAHALDITGPLGIDYPDTQRLRHVAWLAHAMLPYAFQVAGQQPQEVYCELAAPDATTWRYGPPDAASSIAGAAGAFCRVGARRLAPEQAGLVTRGPYGLAALRVLRTYAG